MDLYLADMADKNLDIRETEVRGVLLDCKTEKIPGLCAAAGLGARLGAFRWD